ncbi:MAG: hypothetical protein GMKNLPBB_01937 [Myxococcota bacterium]|nr:hypothetical protein [Myxococcota bacterium]
MTQGIEKRKHHRARVALLVLYRCNTLDEYSCEYAIDVSVGGLFIRTEHPLKMGQKLFLKFTDKDGSHMVETNATVAHVKTGLENGDSFIEIGMGVRFDDLEEETLAVLERVVHGRRYGDETAAPAEGEAAE